MSNVRLCRARKLKKDEFYTLYDDIEKELRYYKQHLKNKIVYCNCDVPGKSNFWNFFFTNFNELGLKKLIATYYDPEHIVYKYEYDGSNIKKYPLHGNGDFRSEECIEILNESDVVITNPPFSLFREYITQLLEQDKEFLILGNQNAITHNEVFPYIKDNKIWLEASIHSGGRIFNVPDDYPILKNKNYGVDKNGRKWISVPGVRWFTNLYYKERPEKLLLWKTYKGNEKDYPYYDNYDAINVNKTSEIPCDYFGKMGVPVSFMNKYNPEQFEIIGSLKTHGKNSDYDYIVDSKTVEIIKGEKITHGNGPVINGKAIYKRIIIRRKDGK